MLSNTHFSMAVHVLSALAYSEGEIVASEDLARTMGTNPSFLRGLIGQLRDAGLVETRLGKGGGTLLARPAGKISLHNVYQATELQPVLKTHECDSRSRCPVAKGMEGMLGSVNERLEKALEKELKKITVADLVSDYVESPR